MTDQLLEKYIRNQVIYYSEIDNLFESILNKNNRIDENFLKNIKNFVSNTTPLEKILILAIGSTGILGTQLDSSTKLNPNEANVITSTAGMTNKVDLGKIPAKIKTSFADRINTNNFSKLSFEEINSIRTVFGIEDNNTNQENLENPLVLLFQELLSKSENLSDDVLEDMNLNKNSIEADLGINKFDSLENWSQNVRLGNNDDVIGLFRQPMKLIKSKDENDLFSQEGVYIIDRVDKERFKESIHEKINFLRSQGASDDIINLMSALGALKIRGALDGSNINPDLIERSKSLLETEDMQVVLSKYITNTASAFTDLDNSDYE